MIEKRKTSEGLVSQEIIAQVIFVTQNYKIIL
jgi:hypothetical protein